MSRVKIQIFHENNAKGETTLIRTVWIDRDSDKNLTGKKAGQLLANNFPEFDDLTTRNGLTKIENGWRKSRTIKPTEMWVSLHLGKSDCYGRRFGIKGKNYERSSYRVSRADGSWESAEGNFKKYASR